MHSGPFGCLTKLGAKRAELVQKFVPRGGAKLAELVQKFVPRGRVRIFRNERTRSTPLDPKLMFWCIRTILEHLGPFGCLTKLGAKRVELVQNFVPRSRIIIFRNVLVRLIPFVCIWDR